MRVRERDLKGEGHRICETGNEEQEKGWKCGWAEGL